MGGDAVAMSLVAAFWAVSFLFVITPGADWAYAVSAGLRHRSVVPAISGVLGGHLAAQLGVAVGVAAWVACTPPVLMSLTVAGALYLVWLGVAMLRAPSTGLEAHPAAASTSPVRQAAVGLGISALNPKVLLLFLALLPQFVDSDAAWPLPVQIVALGLVHVASCAVIYTVVGTGARAVLRSRPAAARAVSHFSGGAMVVIGLVLVVEQVLR